MNERALFNNVMHFGRVRIVLRNVVLKAFGPHTRCGPNVDQEE